MPRKGHNNKGQRKIHAHHQRLAEEALSELSEVLHMEQDERRPDDEGDCVGYPDAERLDDEEDRDEREVDDEQ